MNSQVGFDLSFGHKLCWSECIYLSLRRGGAHALNALFIHLPHLSAEEQEENGRLDAKTTPLPLTHSYGGPGAGEVLALKHKSRILRQWSNPLSGSRKS